MKILIHIQQELLLNSNAQSLRVNEKLSKYNFLEEGGGDEESQSIASLI